MRDEFLTRILETGGGGVARWQIKRVKIVRLLCLW